MEKEKVKRILEGSKKVYVVGLSMGTNPHWDKGIWRKFAVYYLVGSELRRFFWGEEEEAPSLWVKPHKTKSGRWVGGYFESRALGTDRVFEIVYSLCRWAGVDPYSVRIEFLNQ